MKFLCFHGAIGNKENFSIQLQPLEKELKERDIASLSYVNGVCTVNPPEGFQEYFGIGPHYRWFDDGGAAEESMVARIRALPDGDTPEEVIRALSKNAPDDLDPEHINRTRKELLDHLYGLLDADPDIQGVLGYSEGASLAGSLVLDEATKAKRQIKCAIFVTGWPPLGAKGDVVLADEEGERIDIPTLHVMGANDPYKDGTIALYNVCDPETALLFDTGKGHTLPRAGMVIRELGDAVEELLRTAELR